MATSAAIINPTIRITRKPINLGIKVRIRFTAFASALKIAVPQS